MLSDQIVREIVDGTRAALGDKLLSIVLYGSVARGDDGPESDVDIALLVRPELTPEERRAVLFFFSDLWMRTDLFFSPVDIDQNKYDDWVNIVPLYQNIKNEGVVLWNASQTGLPSGEWKKRGKLSSMPA